MTPIFGASTWLWTSPYRSANVELLENIAALGFKAVELPIEDPALIDAAALRPVLKALDLKVHVCGAFGSEIFLRLNSFSSAFPIHQSFCHL